MAAGVAQAEAGESIVAAAGTAVAAEPETQCATLPFRANGVSLPAAVARLPDLPQFLSSEPASSPFAAASRWTKGGSADGTPSPIRFDPPPGSSVIPREVFSPVHDFARGLRKAQWRTDASVTSALPPRMYVDQRTIIREVTSVLELRKGDHCMITLNMLRCLSPRVDYLVSLLGSFDLCKFYHHFVILDDVASVDANGIPVTEAGELVAIMEYANTVPEAVEQVRVGSDGHVIGFFRCFFQLLGELAKCHRVALADYGDMPHIFRVEENLTQEDRDRIVFEAERMLKNHPKYNPFLRNCEHATNLVTSRAEFTSPMVPFGIWLLCRAGLSLLGLAFLHMIGTHCYERYCMAYPIWALCAYAICTIAPLACQGIVQYAMTVHCAYKSYMSSIITLDDFYHLMVKEFLRLLIVAGAAISALILAPAIVRRHGASVFVSWAVVHVYWVADAVFNICASLAIRALLAKFGKWWLIGGSPLKRDESRDLLEVVKPKLD